jgi:hypothetical protein
MTATNPIVLEPAAQQIADAFKKPPFLLNGLSQTRAARAAIDQATAFLRAGLHAAP